MEEFSQAVCISFFLLSSHNCVIYALAHSRVFYVIISVSANSVLYILFQG